MTSGDSFGQKHESLVRNDFWQRTRLAGFHERWRDIPRRNVHRIGLFVSVDMRALSRMCIVCREDTHESNRSRLGVDDLLDSKNGAEPFGNTQ